MGIDSLVKTILIQRYPYAWKNCSIPKEHLDQSKPLFSDPNLQLVGNVLITYNNQPKIRINQYHNCNRMFIDFTYITKYLRENVKNSNDFIQRQVLSELRSFWQEGGKSIHIAFDRESPFNKDPEHDSRYKNVKKKSDEQGGEDDLFDETHIPKDWMSFICMPENKAKVLKLISSKLFDFVFDDKKFPPNNGQRLEIYNGKGFCAPKGKCLYGFGLPVKTQENLDNGGDGYTPLDTTRILSNITHDTLSGNQSKTTTSSGTQDRTFIGVNEAIPASHMAHIKEAELACLYFWDVDMPEDTIIMTTDGDLVLLGLLHAMFRVPSIMENYYERVQEEKEKLRAKKEGKKYVPTKIIERLPILWIRLRMNNGTVNDVNINDLYIYIMTDKRLQGIKGSPILYIVSSLLLSKNDYVKDFVNGMRSVNNVPLPFFVMEKMLSQLNGLFTIHHSHSPIDVPLHMPHKLHSQQFINIEINENIFINYSKMCYLYYFTETQSPKYKKFTRENNLICEKYQSQHGISRNNMEHIENIRQYLRSQQKTNKKSTLMGTKRDLRVVCRNLLWVLLYWINNYRGNCMVPSAIWEYDAFPYFGWSYDFERKRTVRSSLVSRSLQNFSPLSIPLNLHNESAFVSGPGYKRYCLKKVQGKEKQLEYMRIKYGISKKR